jgi:thioredoxin
MSHEINNFETDVIAASKQTPVLVDFWAAWCFPCRMLAPTLEKLAGESDGRWKLAKVNTDEHPELAMRYGIRGIPTVKLIVDGEVVNEFVGVLPEHALRSWLNEALPAVAAN